MELIHTDNPYLFNIDPPDGIQQELDKRNLELEDISHAIGISVGRLEEIMKFNQITSPEFFKIEHEFERRDRGVGVRDIF